MAVELELKLQILNRTKNLETGRPYRADLGVGRLPGVKPQA